VAAATLFLLFLANLALLRESPAKIGESEPRANPIAVIRERDGTASRQHIWPTLRTLSQDPGFRLVCILSFVFTLVRETFNLWTPTYFVTVVGLSDAGAARESALFPLFGGLSVLLCGIVSDRLKQGGRASIMFYGLLSAGAVLFLLGRIDFRTSRELPVALVTLVGFLIIGPYSYLAGAISLDLGGKQGGATTSGIVDGAGYLGGILAGDSVARVSVAYGWRGAFTMLAMAVFLSSVAAWLYRRHARAKILVPDILPEVNLEDSTQSPVTLRGRKGGRT
jgi:OPA family glycerol-3-phosphate transporter-like MFS transporter